jgi:H+/Cl- antiporter ClcA
VQALKVVRLPCFIGATLGSALSTFVPLPLAFGRNGICISGATHTPIACTVMGIELFGIESGLFVGLACFIAYLSGPIGIYHSQIVKAPSIFCIKN